MRRILLVRHGTTDWVEKQIIHGSSDGPLNQKGLLQASQAAKALAAIDAQGLYTSPLTRCLQTAEIIGKAVHLSPREVSGLREMNFGWLEGHPYQRSYQGNPGRLVKLFDQYSRILIRSISGDSSGRFRRRVMSTWRELLDSTNEATTIIVGHTFFFHVVLTHYFGNPYSQSSGYYPLSPCSISEFGINDHGEGQLIRLNEAPETDKIAESLQHRRQN